MRLIRSWRFGASALALVVLLVLVAWGAGIGSGSARTGTAVEFYNPALKHYFLTADPAEAAALGAGTSVRGWERTGGEFTVATEPARGLSAVCRFVGAPGQGRSNQFYTADARECAQLKNSSEWTFETIAFYVPMPTAGACPANTYPVWRSRSSDGIAGASQRFTTDPTAYARMTRQGFQHEGLAMCSPQSDADFEADIVRLLEQASLGSSEALLQEVKSKGMASWLDEQLALNATRYAQYPFFVPPDDPATCVDDRTPPVTPEKFCHTYKIAPWPVGWEFFRQAKTAPDQLRLRMAHVWHQIFVVSDGPGTVFRQPERAVGDDFNMLAAPFARLSLRAAARHSCSPSASCCSPSRSASSLPAAR